MTKEKSPKVFISYSWTPEENKKKVIKIAEELENNGISIVLDKRELKLGNDIYAFMERIVLDESITKVLIFCNKDYTEKANARKSGVGAEGSIISSNVYNQVEQNKFIPIIMEKDENNKPYMPVYLSSRLYVDLTDEKKYKENFELLIRDITDQPPINKTELGTMTVLIPPKDNPDLIHIEHMWKQRFGLDLAPIDRIYSLLKKPDEWRNTLNYTHYTYHNTFSEFNIEVIDIKDDNSEISHYYPDCNSYRGRMIIKQGNVPLDEYPCFFTDSTNQIILKPEIKLLSFSHKAIFFYLLTEDNLGILNNFLLRGKVVKLEQIYYRTPILLFDSFDDLVNFSRKALKNIELIEKYNVSKNKSIELYRFLDNHHPKYDLQILMFQIEMFYNEWVINEKLTLKELL